MDASAGARAGAVGLHRPVLSESHTFALMGVAFHMTSWYEKPPFESREFLFFKGSESKKSFLLNDQS